MYPFQNLLLLAFCLSLIFLSHSIETLVFYLSIYTLASFFDPLCLSLTGAATVCPCAAYLLAVTLSFNGNQVAFKVGLGAK